jgi:hypothetical protein
MSLHEGRQHQEFGDRDVTVYAGRFAHTQGPSVQELRKRCLGKRRLHRGFSEAELLWKAFQEPAIPLSQESDGEEIDEQAQPLEVGQCERQAFQVGPPIDSDSVIPVPRRRT